MSRRFESGVQIEHIHGFGYVACHADGNMAVGVETAGGLQVRIPVTREQALQLIRALCQVADTGTGEVEGGAC